MTNQINYSASTADIIALLSTDIDLLRTCNVRFEKLGRDALATVARELAVTFRLRMCTPKRSFYEPELMDVDWLAVARHAVNGPATGAA